MAKTRADLGTSIQNVETAEAALATAVADYMTAVNNMINRFLAREAAGNDFQAEVDRLAPVVQDLSDKLAAVTSAIAQANVEAQ